MWISKSVLKEQVCGLRKEVKQLNKQVLWSHKHVEWCRMYDEVGRLTNCYNMECVKCGFRADYFGNEAIIKMKGHFEGKVLEMQRLIDKDIKNES